mmetsp:Transcript_13623/g.16692  ORF Transcript_13623/g.16692 Transcript_13623/m.16692 type:complete len:95 (+) Transcript_13623:1623-1907(+)
MTTHTIVSPRSTAIVIGDQELAFVMRDIREYHAKIAHRHKYELARFAIHENCALIPVLELEIAITSQDFVRVWIIVLETIPINYERERQKYLSR